MRQTRKACTRVPSEPHCNVQHVTHRLSAPSFSNILDRILHDKVLMQLAILLFGSISFNLAILGLARHYRTTCCLRRTAWCTFSSAESLPAHFRTYHLNRCSITPSGLAHNPGFYKADSAAQGTTASSGQPGYRRL